MDDWIKSVDDPQHAIKLMKDVKAILTQSGFKLTKFMSNDRQIVKMIPEEERGKPLLNIDLDKQELPRDRALGVKWDLNTDEFFYEPKKIDKPFTRRGMISIISSLFDPLGFASPVIIVAKMIFQEVTKLKLPWDEQVPEVIQKRWKVWCDKLNMLTMLRVPRCLKPKSNVIIIKSQLNHFCDASSHSYGVVTYIKMIDQEGGVHTMLDMSKAPLVPINSMSIPRLELTAAVLEAKIDSTFWKQMSVPLEESCLRSDSEIVLGYIYNQEKRFHVFVANRIEIIHQLTSPNQWKYIEGKNNPADSLTRGLIAEQLCSEA